LQLPPPGAILSSVIKAFEECHSIKRFHNKHNTNYIQNKVLTRNSKGFTLAEVLIALVIIGIIAAITVPTIIANAQKNAFKSALKKNYSILQQAFNLERGYFFNGDYLDYNYQHTASFTEEVFNNLKPHLNISKVCGHQKYKECWQTTKAKNGSYPSGFNINGYDCPECYTFILSDGTAVLMDMWVDSTLQVRFGITKNLISTNNNIIVLIDVNGPKKPNTLGKDVFGFALTSKGLTPSGADNKSVNCDKLNTTNNYDCTAKVLKD
jgi:prepilin-type N-terminal cleavage/methylation domain-containing protein